MDQVTKEVIKKLLLEDIKNLPSQMTPKDIYEYYNKDGHKMGWNKVYAIAKKIGRALGPGNRIYISKTTFIKFLYGEGVD